MSNQLTVDRKSDLELEMSRVFDAPLALVWAAHTQPEHLKRWWGRGNPLDVEFDFRVGGGYRFVEHAPDGNDYAFRGEVLEIDEPHRLVLTFEFEGMPGHISTDTYTFAEEGGRTVLTTRSRFTSKEDLDGMVESGMSDGAAQSYEALDRLLAALKG